MSELLNLKGQVLKLIEKSGRLGNTPEPGLTATEVSELLPDYHPRTIRGALHTLGTDMLIYHTSCRCNQTPIYHRVTT